MACDPRANPAEYRARQRNENARMAAMCDAFAFGKGVVEMKHVLTTNQIYTTRDYVEANTRHDSNQVNISEILRGAEWPRPRKGIAWPDLFIISSILMLTAYCLIRLM